MRKVRGASIEEVLVKGPSSARDENQLTRSVPIYSTCNLLFEAIFSLTVGPCSILLLTNPQALSTLLCRHRSCSVLDKMRATGTLRMLARGTSSKLAAAARTSSFQPRLRPSVGSSVLGGARAPMSTSARLLLPSDDPGGKPNTGQHRTVYDDFFNILESADPTTTVSVASTSPTSLTLQDGLVLSEPIVLLNNQVFLWDHPRLNQDYAVPSGIGWEDWLGIDRIQPGTKLQVTDKIKATFAVFELVDERPEIILFGTGKRVLPPPAPIREYLNSLGIQVDVQSTVSNPPSSTIVGRREHGTSSMELKHTDSLHRCVERNTARRSFDVQHAHRGRP